MDFQKSQSYNLSPDEYLQKFQHPHSIISSKGSTELDEKDEKILNEILNKCYNDNEQSEELKCKIVSQLSGIVESWMKEVTVCTNNELIDFASYGYGLKVFGSYRLKTNSFDGDIDMICIVPEYFSREKHFFHLLVESFKKNQSTKDIFSIPDALVPLISLTVYEVQIDLLISRIPLPFLRDNPNFFEGEISSTHNVHERQLRSINGYRTALYLQKYVKKYKNYRIALKAIKMWAKNKGIYSQIYGYLGGAAFSIMLAKICQLYPNYSSLQLLDRFFFIFANWVWSIPISIQKMQYMERPDCEMVIFTPLEPHMNAAHYISKFTCNITRKHFRMASKMIQEINKGKKSWADLFEPTNFFNQYRNFVEISVFGEKMEDFIRWRGNVESKIRKFIKYLQNQNELNQSVEVNPIPRQFQVKHLNFKNCSKYYIGFKCNPNTSLNDYSEIDLTQPVRHFLELLENYSEIEKAPKEINIGFAHVNRQNIPPEVFDSFKSLINQSRSV